jgi:hypothetical protein
MRNAGLVAGKGTRDALLTAKAKAAYDLCKVLDGHSLVVDGQKSAGNGGEDLGVLVVVMELDITDRAIRRVKRRNGAGDGWGRGGRLATTGSRADGQVLFSSREHGALVVDGKMGERDKRLYCS